MSKIALARALGVTPRAVQTYETEGAPPSRASALAHALTVDPAFFFQAEASAVSVDQGFFRALRRASAGQLNSARAAATVGIQFYGWVAERFSLPDVLVPELDHHEPEMAAAAVRAIWGRNEGPLPNLVQLSEAHGVRVLSLPPDADSVDTFSLWSDGCPYVFLSTTKSAERMRLDLAHELGHLVMHSRSTPSPDRFASTSRVLEQEAEAFAAALLMPSRSVIAHAGREPAVPEILRLRSYYRVSAMAMTYRLHELGRLTDWGYRQNCATLARRGFRSDEPGGIRRELSRVFASVFPVLRDQGLSVGQVAHANGVLPAELHGLTLGQAPVSVDGQGVMPSPGRSTLHVVGGRSAAIGTALRPT